MGKKAKAHRAKVEKRNRVINQQKYAMQNALNRMMQQIATQKEQTVETPIIEEENKPFEFAAEPISSGIKGFEIN
jgi:hypothetical protein